MRRLLLAAALAAVAAECRAADEKEPTLDGKPLGAWVVLLKEGGYEDRAAAAAALMRMGKDARPAMPALIDVATNDVIFRVRVAATGALGEVGPTKEAVPALARLLRENNSWEVRAAAAAALAKCGPGAKEAIPALRAAAHEWNAGVRREAAKALGAIEAAPWVHDVKYGDADARPRAVDELGRLDPAATEIAGPVLISALEDPDAKVRRAAAASLARIGAAAKGATVALRAVLEKDKDADVRAASASALGALGADPAPLPGDAVTEIAVPVLISALEDPDAKVRRAAAASLARIGAAAKGAAVALRAVLEKDKDADVRAASVSALGALGAGLTPLPGDADWPKGDKDLDGEWQPVSVVQSGEILQEPSGHKFVVVIQGGSINNSKISDPKITYPSGTIRADAAAAPKAIDLKWPFIELAIKAVYEVKGDVLRVCSAWPGNDRPTEFSAKEGSGWFLMTFRRVKK